MKIRKAKIQTIQKHENKSKQDKYSKAEHTNHNAGGVRERSKKRLLFRLLLEQLRGQRGIGGGELQQDQDSQR